LFTASVPKLIAKGFQAVLLVALMCGESSMPTHMVYPEWLFIDTVSIATFDRILLVLLPRLSIFGVSGSMQHMTGITTTAASSIALILIAALLTSVFLAIVITEATNGNPNDILYWIATPISQVAAVMAIAMFWFTTSRHKSNKWAKNLGLQVTGTESIIQDSNLALAPIFWIQLAESIQHLHTCRFMQVHGHLVDTYDGDMTKGDAAGVMVINPTADQAATLAAEPGFEHRMIHSVPVEELAQMQTAPRLFHLGRIRENDGASGLMDVLVGFAV